MSWPEFPKTIFTITGGTFVLTGAVDNGVEIAYQYIEQEQYNESIDLGYSFGAELTGQDPLEGYRAPYTQKILNNLPDWLEMRKNHLATGQTLVNSWAINLEDTLELYSDLRKNQFLSTTNNYSDLHLGVSELSFQEEKVYQPVFNNILYNTSFTFLGPKRYQKPEGWDILRNNIDAISINTDNSLYGENCIYFDGSKSTANMKQTREFRILGGKLVFSVYYKTEDNGLSLVDYYSSDECGAIITVLYADSTIEHFGLKFKKNTSNKYLRLYTTLNLTKETKSFTVNIVNNINSKFYIDLPMLEIGSKPSQWSSASNDMPIFSLETNRTVTGVQALFYNNDTEKVKKLEIIPLGSEDAFKYIRVPTRIIEYNPTQDTVNIFNSTYGRQINFFNEIMPTLWSSDSSQILERNSLAPDKFGLTLPADLYLDQNGNKYIDKSLVNNPSNCNILAVCVIEDILYVVSKETYANKIGYYIKFIIPKKQLYEDNFLQSIGDLKIELELGTLFGMGSIPEEVNRIGKVDNLPGVIFIDTTLERRFYFQLKFDYFYADYNLRKIFFRENYTKENGILQVI